MDPSMLRRIIVFLIAMNVMASGVIMSTVAVLGTSPISSIPFVCSLGIDWLTIGEATLVFNLFFIAFSAIMVGVKFKMQAILQLVALVVFSVLCDVYSYLLSGIVLEEYWMQWSMIIASAIVLGLGITLSIAGDITMLPGDYFVNVLSLKTKVSFGKVKIVNDVTLILISILLSFMFFGFGEFVGVREGTIFAAVFVGVFVNMFKWLLSDKLAQWMGHTPRNIFEDDVERSRSDRSRRRRHRSGHHYEGWVGGRSCQPVRRRSWLSYGCTIPLR